MLFKGLEYYAKHIIGYFLTTNPFPFNGEWQQQIGSLPIDKMSRLNQFVPLTGPFLVSEKECSIVEGCAGILSSGMAGGLKVQRTAGMYFVQEWSA